MSFSQIWCWCPRSSHKISKVILTVESVYQGKTKMEKNATAKQNDTQPHHHDKTTGKFQVPIQMAMASE
jgi:hypothetical protein